MRFHCPHCNSQNTKTRSSLRVSATVTRAYVQCRNSACGFSWRMDCHAAFALTPPAKPAPGVLIPSSTLIDRKRAARQQAAAHAIEVARSHRGGRCA
ncbi:ogr/Delta-like zinc finger family protein [Hylemonella gracilis]|uniref:ogr/Delta-like zinc finger family protein n=1 Tax=Hylemonella gracilis TaxID=80880 RepID=UPI0009DF0321